MKAVEIIEFILYLLIVLALVKPLGCYMARVYAGKPCGLDRLVGPVERFSYRFCGVSPLAEMRWKNYLVAMLLFNTVGLLVLYAIQRCQGYLPLNPQSFPGVSPSVAFNTAVSFVTNTDWQIYSGENSLSYFTQMIGLGVQHFLSAATGMALLVAFTRGVLRQQGESLGNFWVDLIRTVLYILLPLSIILSIILVSQGVIQNFKPYQSVTLLQPVSLVDQTTPLTSEKVSVSTVRKTQLIPLGPVASQVAIKQLGSNGGGFFNANAAHPFENPNPLSNFFEMLAILLIPAALCYTFGELVGDRRQGWAILLAMLLVFIPLAGLTYFAEQQSPPIFSSLGIADQGNMEGKETRFGIAASTLWATATTATANGSVNSMHGSYTGLGTLGPILLMHFGEVVFGGVGSGLYTMLLLVIITVFVAGLMVGRTPEYLGKKIEPYEIKMVVFAVFVIPLLVVVCTAISAVSPLSVNALGNPGAHGFTELLYAWTSMGNNNGSAMAGLKLNTPFFSIVGAIVMLLSRYWIAICTLAIAGSLVRKKKIPVGSGTLSTDTPMFVFLLVAVTVILGILSFLPALALGPIAEALMARG